jgi:serine protease Do
MKRDLSVWVAALAVFAAWLTMADVRAETRSTGGSALAMALNEAFADVYEKVAPAVVVIEAHRGVNPTAGRGAMPDAWDYFFRGQPPANPRMRGDRPTQGSGFVISRDGLIVTNNHVVEGAAENGLRVTFKDGRKMPAVLVGVDPKTDLALLKVEGDELPTLDLADSDEVRVGQFAFAIGAPFELPYTFTFGLVSAKGRSNLTNITYEDYIQTDASINPGNSGGPLVDIHGRVIGVNTLINGINRGLGFAIPTNMVRDVVEQLAENGRVIRPWLGIEILGIEESEVLRSSFPEVPSGVVVDAIRPKTPAWHSELRPGDVILRVDAREVRTARDVQRAVLARRVGDMVQLEIWRKGQERSIQIQAGEQETDFLPAAVTPGNTPPQSVPVRPPENLGIQAEDLTVDAAKAMGFTGSGGVLVTNVANGSPADVAGLRPGDIITHVGNQPVATADAFEKSIEKIDRERGAMILIERENQKTFVILKP